MVTLDGTARSLKAGDPLVIEVPGAGTGRQHGTGFDVVALTRYAEMLWYANGTAADPTTAPARRRVRSRCWSRTLTVAAAGGTDLGSRYGTQVNSVVVRSGWTDVGVLLDTPVNSGGRHPVDGPTVPRRRPRPPGRRHRRWSRTRTGPARR